MKTRWVVLGVSLLGVGPLAWADQVAFYQNSDGIELERFSNGTIDEAQELANLNAHHPTCPCSSIHLPEATPFKPSEGKRWKVQGQTVVEVEDTRSEAAARRQRKQAAAAKLQAVGLTPQDLMDALGQ